jgi:DNA polymerase-3 subunit alpha
MQTYAPLHLHTHYSVLDGLGRPEKIARKAASMGCPAVAVSDHGNIGACVNFTKAISEVGIRPILGCELYLCKKDPRDVADDPVARKANSRPYSHLVVLAKNKKGWGQLIKAVSLSNSKEFHHYSPRLSLDNLADFAAGGDLLCFSGHPGSDLGNALFKDARAAYSCSNPDEIRDHIDPDYQTKLVGFANRYISTFGRENFFLEIQVLNPEHMPACAAIAKALRWLGKKMGIRCVATADSHYVDREDAYDQRTVLCSKLKTTHNRVARRIAEDDGDLELGGFFRGDCFHIPTYDEMLVHHRESELAMTIEIAAMCEDYEILGPPRLPTYPLTGGETPEAFLRGICEAGFSAKLESRESSLDRPISEYRGRLESELGVLKEADLSSYFLIVRHGTEYGRSRGWLMGPARGSSAGSLVAFLSGITSIDPLPYGLLFERFYNAGRNTPGKVSLPDIDMDIPIVKRDEVFREYQHLFGLDKVARVATFQTLQGRSALDDVLSAHEIPFDERKVITQHIPDKARISEELQAMVDRGEDPSILRFSLDLYAEELSEWARLEEDGSISGDYGRYFEQAIRLEGTKSCISTHAAGVIISDTPLGDQFPMKWDESTGANLILMEYPDVEACGGVKLDLLGIAMLNKGEAVRDLCRFGEIRADF